MGLNSHYFNIIGDGKIKPIVGVYIPIIRIPIKVGMTIPNIRSLDCGTHNNFFDMTPQLVSSPSMYIAVVTTCTRLWAPDSVIDGVTTI